MKKIALIGILLTSVGLYAESPYVELKFIPLADMFQERLYEYFPKEIAQFLDKYRGCTHWEGEYAYDDAREKQIGKGAKENCIDFKLGITTLENKYHGNSKIIEAKQMMKEVENGETINYSFLWNDPKRESKVLSKYIESEGQWILKSVDSQMKEYDAALKANSDKNKLQMLRRRLAIQRSYLEQVLSEIGRLHPVTRKKIDELARNKVFLERAAESR